ncbi:MAG: DNA alkylation repair protein [Nanoarchaeota archaeon]
MSVKDDLKELANPEKAKILQGFFKTGKGQYGEGDIFLGITVSEQRKVAKRYIGLYLEDIQKLLNSNIHEHRLVGLLILVEKYKKTKDKKIVDFYLKNSRKVNNWDLVDLTAHTILGAYLFERDRNILYKLAKSDNLWEKRISIVATFHFIKNNDLEDTFKIAEILLDDEHDLIHKAVGWMLRETGKKNQKAEEKFLDKHVKKMPRTMLRYAIEKFDEKKRKYYMTL